LYWKRNNRRSARYKQQGLATNIIILVVCLLILFISFNSCNQSKYFPSTDSRPTYNSIGINHISTIKGVFSQPKGLSVDNEGRIYLADSGQNRIYIIDNKLEVIDSIGRFGWQKGEFDRPIDVAVDSRLRLYIADSGNNRIQRFSLIDQAFSVLSGEKSDITDAEKNIYEPQAITVDSRGYIYVVDTWNHRILKIDALGRMLLSIGGIGILKNPQDISIDNINNIYVCDTGNNRVCKFDIGGVRVASWGKEGSDKGQFRNPTGISNDVYNNVYVVDQGNRRIQIFDSSGNYLVDFGQQYLQNPYGIAIFRDGYIYITDLESSKIEVFKVLINSNK
jgi:DNA-binding beta-propeller fold protein YncE